MPSDITGTNVLDEDEHGRRRVPLRRGTDLHEHSAGRRNQPHAAEDAGRAAAGDAGTRSDGRPGRRTSCPSRSSSSPRRTRSSRKEPIRCPKRSSTASCSTSRSTIRRSTKKNGSSPRRRAARSRRSARCSRPKAILYLQKQITQIEVAPLTINYVARLVRATRPADDAAPKFVKRTGRLGRRPAAGQYLIAGRQGDGRDGRPLQRRRSTTSARWRSPCCGTASRATSRPRPKG